MRPLTEEVGTVLLSCSSCVARSVALRLNWSILAMQETKNVFEKLYKFIGKDIKSMIERADGRYCLRLHKNKIYYVSEALMKKATNVSSCSRPLYYTCCQRMCSIQWPIVTC